MILSFSTTELVDRILDGTKIHTIREDKHDRWKIGMLIHAWYKNPRNVKQNPIEIHQYAMRYYTPYKHRNYPEKCISTQKITMTYELGILAIWIENNCIGCIENNEIINDYSYSKTLTLLIQNDGFNTVTDFFDWFKPLCPFTRKIIHWTDFRY